MEVLTGKVIVPPSNSMTPVDCLFCHVENWIETTNGLCLVLFYCNMHSFCVLPSLYQIPPHMRVEV